MTRLALLVLLALTLGSCGRPLTAPVASDPTLDIDCYSRTTYEYTGHVTHVADIPAASFGLVIDTVAS